MRVTSSHIKKTKTFKALPAGLKKIVLSRNNVRNSLQQGVNLVNSKGYSEWCQNTRSRWYNREIVRELTSH